MRVLTIVHESDAGPGVFLGPLSDAAASMDTWLVAEQPEPPAVASAYDAILSFGGSVHPHQEDQHPWLKSEKRFLAGVLAEGVPLLGVCLGYELVAEVAGLSVRRLDHPEIGWYEVSLTPEGQADPVLGPAGPRFDALEWHSYAVDRPAGAATLAQSASCLQAYRLGNCTWGIQFHAEVTGDDFQHWLDDHTADEDAVRVGLDVEAIAAECRPRLPAWHALGVGLCERFLGVASSR